jgi:hypothetical protein
MSSQSVVDKITTFINTNFPSEPLVDLTAEFRDLGDLLTANGIAHIPICYK